MPWAHPNDKSTSVHIMAWYPSGIIGIQWLTRTVQGFRNTNPWQKWWYVRSPFYTVLSNVRFGVGRYQSILPYSSQKWWDVRSPFYTVLSNVRFGVVRYQSILPYSSGLLHWHKDGSVDFCGTRANSLHYIVPTRIPRAWPLTSAETPLTWVPFKLFGITWIPEWVSDYLRNKV